MAHVTHGPCDPWLLDRWPTWPVTHVTMTHGTRDHVTRDLWPTEQMCRDQTVMAHLLPTMTNVTHDPRDITDCVCVGCYHRSVRSTRCRPPIHAVSSHVATDKDPSEFWSIFSDNLQPIATRGKKACGTLLVDQHCSNGYSIKRAPLSVSYEKQN